MNQQELSIRIKRFQQQQNEMIIRKNGDYANADALSNFKLAGNVSGLNAQLNVLSLIATKVARLGVLLNSDKEPNNESVQDSVLDLANYAALLHCILAEGSPMPNAFSLGAEKVFEISDERGVSGADLGMAMNGELGQFAMFVLTKDKAYLTNEMSAFWSKADYDSVIKQDDPQELLMLAASMCVAEHDRLEALK